MLTIAPDILFNHLLISFEFHYHHHHHHPLYKIFNDSGIILCSFISAITFFKILLSLSLFILSLSTSPLFFYISFYEPFFYSNYSLHRLSLTHSLPLSLSLSLSLSLYLSLSLFSYFCSLLIVTFQSILDTCLPFPFCPVKRLRPGHKRQSQNNSYRS